jgi:ubiquinone/menaquinone biosynthesis C-methylase UbiE
MTFDQVRKDWTRLGAEDPLWAVSVAPDKRGGRWDVEQFLATGRADVAATMAWLDTLNLGQHWEKALDFGCGAGRLSQALTDYAGEVVGVDVSAPMLDTARKLDPGGRCRFVLNQEPDLKLFADNEFDLIYSDLVLQHLPRGLIERYLGELVRVLEPGGVAVLSCTTRPLWTFKGVIWRFAPGALVRLGQRTVLRYPAPMRMTAMSHRRIESLLSRHNAHIVDTISTSDRAAHWRSTRYVVRRHV